MEIIKVENIYSQQEEIKQAKQAYRQVRQSRNSFQITVTKEVVKTPRRLRLFGKIEIFWPSEIKPSNYPPMSPDFARRSRFLSLDMSNFEV